MFSQFDWLSTLVGVLGTTCASVIGAVVLLLRVYYPARKERRDQDARDLEAANAGLLKLVHLYEEQGERREKIMQTQALTIDAANKEHMECREQVAYLKASQERLFDYVLRFHGAIKTLGADPGPLPSLPDFPAPGSTVEFLGRQAAQELQADKAAVKEVSKQIKEEKAKLTSSGPLPTLRADDESPRRGK